MPRRFRSAKAYCESRRSWNMLSTSIRDPQRHGRKDMQPLKPFAIRLLSQALDHTTRCMRSIKSMPPRHVWRWCLPMRVAEPYSAPVPACSGFPQGSVLGSILFLIFVNDLPDVLSDSVLLVADDVKLISARSQNGELHQNLEAAFQWSDDCDLPLNVWRWRLPAVLQKARLKHLWCQIWKPYGETWTGYAKHLLAMKRYFEEGSRSELHCEIHKGYICCAYESQGAKRWVKLTPSLVHRFYAKETSLLVNPTCMQTWSRTKVSTAKFNSAPSQ